MAGGIDWFRWHHGSVTNPKFQLVAKKAAARLGDVITVWAFILEKASADTDRGTIGEIDFETLDFLLGADEGTTIRILDAMAARGLILGSRIAKWEENQPKREREDDTAAERKARQRAREAEQNNVTPCHATSHQETPRGEESREEEKREEEGKSKAKASAAPKPRKSQKTSLPPDFCISDSVRQWAASKGFDRLDEHLESFTRKAKAKGYTYVDWDLALENAIAEDWAKLRTVQPRASPQPFQSQSDKAKAWADKLTGRASNENRTIIDITPSEPLSLG